MSQHRPNDVGLVVGRVHPGDQHPSRTSGLRGDEGVGDEPVRALRAVGLPAAEPDAGDQRNRAGSADDAEQRVQALDAAVAAASALLGIAVGRFHGVVDVDVRQRVGAGQQRRLPAQVDQQPGRDRVELPDMPKHEGPQERPQRRRGVDTGEQPAHRAVPQQRHVLDRVGAGDHARDQRRDLQSGVPAAGLPDPHVLSDQRLQPGPLRELKDRREASARHEVGVIENHRVGVRDSHLPDAFPLVLNRSLDKTDSPTTEKHLGFTARAKLRSDHDYRWIRG